MPHQYADRSKADPLAHGIVDTHLPLLDMRAW
jgi:hypothetical protein